MSDDEVVTSTGRVWLGDDGIVRSIADPSNEETLESAKENMAAIAKVSGGTKRPVLVDLSGSKGVRREARSYYTGQEAAAHYLAVALLVGSPLGRVIGNFYIGLNRLAAPTRLFSSEDEALKWLRGFLK